MWHVSNAIIPNDPERILSSMIIANDELIISGGMTTKRALNDIYKVNLKDALSKDDCPVYFEEMAILNRHTRNQDIFYGMNTNKLLTNCAGHSMSYDPLSKNIVLFGGVDFFSENIDCFNDTYLLNTKNNILTKINDDCDDYLMFESDNLFHPSFQEDSSHDVIRDLDKRLEELEDVLSFDNKIEAVPFSGFADEEMEKIWESKRLARVDSIFSVDQQSQNVMPNAVWGHRMCFWKQGYHILFGGEKYGEASSSAGTVPMFEKEGICFVFDHTVNKYYPLKHRSGVTPTARCLHAMCVGDDKLFIAGGISPQGFITDMNVLDLWTYGWTSLSCGDHPFENGLAGCTAVQHDSLIYLYGGMNQRGVHLQDLCMFDYRNNEWYNLTENEESKPVERTQHSMCIDDSGTHVLVYGGQNSILLNDLVVFDTRV
eukprot:TRINITY_DN1566_c0_g1_i1.p1 TRINITY_DN1566_c0_g1~~TRINITY_DN1566_c0_g1_i1.p1  ORF type:complete len:429 (-),score=93.72 TRINITY_DN1566_c0_g1_i1:6-1292(-)